MELGGEVPSTPSENFIGYNWFLETAPEVYPPENYLYEFIVVVRWASGKFDGLLVDRRPNLQGQPSKFTPIQSQIVGSSVVVSVNLEQIDNPARFDWGSVTRLAPHPDPSISDYAPNIGHAEWAPGSAPALVNGGFETSEPTKEWLPQTFGDWSGDNTQILVGPDSGVSSRSGSGMLKFIAATPGGAAAPIGSESWQVVDLSLVRAALDAGEVVTVTLTAYFNRLAGDAQTDTAFGVLLDAYDGSPSTFPARWTPGPRLARQEKEITTDADTATWEPASVSMVVPRAATFLAARISAAENVRNDTSGSEFAGHFADDASLSVEIPLPELTIESAVIVSWPTSTAGWQLESATAINGPWQPVDAKPVLAEAQNTVTLRTANAGRYFRLRTP